MNFLNKKTILLLLLSLIILPNYLFSSWPMFMGNHYLTGNNDEIVPDDTTLNWSFQAPSYLFYPVPHDNIIFVNCMDKHIYALDEITSKIIWKCKLDYPPMKSPVTYKNYVLVTAGDHIYCIDIKKGTILWSRKEGISVQLSTPIVIGGIVYYGSRKFFYARLINNGHLVWKNEKVKIYGGTPIYWNKKIYFISKEFQKKRSQLFCLSAVNGKLLWQQDIPSDANIFTPVVYNEKVFIGSINHLYSFNAKNGKLLWIKPFEHHIASSLVFANKRLYISLDNSKIYMLNPGNGNIIDSFNNFNQKGSSFIIIGETLFIPNLKGELYSYNSFSKKVNWKFKTEFSSKRGTLSSANGRIYMAMGMKLYSVSTGILPPALSPVASLSEEKKSEKETILVQLKDNQNKHLSGEVTVQQDNKITRYKTQNGKAAIKVEKDKEFSITARAKDFFVKTITRKPEQKKKSIDIRLDPIRHQASYVFQDIGFKYNSAELTTKSIPTLKEIAKLLNENPQLKIEIRGHTDSTGNDEYNLKLSGRRADKVKEFMVKNGITDTKIKTKGFGESKPITSNDTEEGKAKNRRVEFIILTK